MFWVVLCFCLFVCFLDREVIFVYFLWSIVKHFAEILAIKTDGWSVPQEQPNLGPFSTNAVVRKNLLQILVFSQNASLAKQGKIEKVTKRMTWGLGVQGVDEDSVDPTT